MRSDICILAQVAQQHLLVRPAICILAQLAQQHLLVRPAICILAQLAQQHLLVRPALCILAQVAQQHLLVRSAKCILPLQHRNVRSDFCVHPICRALHTGPSSGHESELSNVIRPLALVYVSRDPYKQQ